MPATCTAREVTVGIRRPEANPCNTRKKIKLSISHARPQSSEPAKNRPSAPINTFLPSYFFISHPENGTAIPRASVYPVTTHCVTAKPDENIFARSFTAMLTMVVSSMGGSAPNTRISRVPSIPFGNFSFIYPSP